MNASRADFRVKQNIEGKFYLEQYKWPSWKRVDTYDEEWGSFSLYFDSVEQAEEHVRRYVRAMKPDPIVKEIYIGQL